jgi:hypothetical protein
VIVSSIPYNDPGGKYGLANNTPFLIKSGVFYSGTGGHKAFISIPLGHVLRGVSSVQEEMR